jgi:hypothetical protein
LKRQALQHIDEPLVSAMIRSSTPRHLDAQELRSLNLAEPVMLVMARDTRVRDREDSVHHDTEPCWPLKQPMNMFAPAPAT